MTDATDTAEANFGDVVLAAAADRRLVVQPRMGMSRPEEMRRGLAATRGAAARTVGTITLDSYTRVGDHDAARAALEAGADLNGYPIVAHPPEVTEAVVEGIRGPDFPVQVRHGSASPQYIVDALTRVGLHATEGGPVSYCLPYSRLPVADSVTAWAEACRVLGDLGEHGPRAHLETFGGCMMGQLCPPSMLVAISVLEACFFRQFGIDSVSLSYAQQTDPVQDAEAIAALRALADEFLPDLSLHIVVYAYMGVFPRSAEGATRLVRDAAALGVRAGAHRLIVKTTAESRRIPTIAENVDALRAAAETAERTRAVEPAATPPADTGILAAARALVETVLSGDADVGRALVGAVRRGVIDVPYCLHPDNRGRTSATVGPDGRLHWTRTGGLPRAVTQEDTARTGHDSSDDLLRSLYYVQRRFDRAAAGAAG
ncbi:methylaspartate mutase [Streptomyces sp. NPDC008150]|uniref:methylaspartate mutase n=1 Tax=Streptomyces sp. NPDC008150 TaxID=3364816 RepID=UPI0036E64AD9